MVTSNISFNEILYVNKPLMDNGERNTIWKARIKFFLEAIDFDLCEYVLDSSFVLNNFINNEVVNKPRELWTT